MQTVYISLRVPLKVAAMQGLGVAGDARIELSSELHAELSKEEREFIFPFCFTQDKRGGPVLTLGKEEVVVNRDDPHRPVVTNESFLSNLRAIMAERKAEEAKRKEKLEKQILVALEAPLSDWLHEGGLEGGLGVVVRDNGPRLNYLPNAAMKDQRIKDRAQEVKEKVLPEAKKKWLERKEEADKNREESRERRAAAKEAKEQERLAWIKEHGSRRLGIIQAEGLECGAIYKDERIRRELGPSWSHQPAHFIHAIFGDGRGFDQVVPRNPPLLALEELLAARAFYEKKEGVDLRGQVELTAFQVGGGRIQYALSAQLAWCGVEAYHPITDPRDHQEQGEWRKKEEEEGLFQKV
jgi:hypothetical protein